MVVVGGGPAGSACAIELSHLAQHLGHRLRVILYEGKSFTGISHYNQCVGVVSPPIVQILEKELAIPFPRHLVQRQITGYTLHGERRHLVLDGYDEEPSYALRRIEFDAYLLDQVREAGVEVVQSRVTDLELHANHVVVYSESDCIRADVVAGAFGTDEGSAAAFRQATHYAPPRCMHSIVTKLHPTGEPLPAGDSHIHAFLPRSRTIEFGAITPKSNHLTINVAGATVDSTVMDWFLHYEPMRRNLPPTDHHHPTQANDLRYFRGSFPVSVARHFYGDRYVIMGDAAGLVRAFKGKGINSACLTGIWAARCMMRTGISRQAFASDFKQACAEILDDIPYGQMTRRLVTMMQRLDLVDALLAVAEGEPRLRQALFQAVSGHSPYRVMWHNLAHLPFLMRTALSVAHKRLARQPVQPLDEPAR